MAMYALDGIGCGLAALNDVVDEVSMTAKATVLKDRCVTRMDHDRLMEVLQRESSRVPVPIVCLSHVLRDERMRQMTIGTNGCSVMWALAPGRVLIVHDVAVGAGARIRGEVAEPLTIVEREHAHAEH